MSLWDPVYKLVKQIPRGRVLSYGAVAKALRLKGGARSAGRAMSATPQGKGIPWHRVLNAAGKIVIREPYSSLQRRLLESEGIEVIENRVKMKTYLWTPPRKSAPKQSQNPRKNDAPPNVRNSDGAKSIHLGRHDPPRPVAAIASQIAGFRFDTIDPQPARRRTDFAICCML